MNTEIENIIINNDYAELTAEQKSAVNEWAASEEEFVTMKQIIASAPLLNADVSPSPNLKASLMDTFAATYPAGTALASSGGGAVQQKGNNKKVIFMWFRAVAAVAAVLLAVFLIYPLFNSNDESNLVAENKVDQKEKAQTPGNQTIGSAKKEADQIETESNQAQITEEIPQAPPSELKVPTTGPMDGKAFVSQEEEIVRELAMSAEDVVLDFTASSPITNYTSMDAEIINLSPTTSFSGAVNVETQSSFSSGSTTMRADNHSDRIAVADLPDGSRQVIHERPELLDVLHTSF